MPTTNIENQLSAKVKAVLSDITTAIAGTQFCDCTYLVGGSVRDAALGLPSGQDIDIVTEGPTDVLAAILAPLSSTGKVDYPRFGTAMLTIRKMKVELAQARKETYNCGSRKPTVERGTISDDAFRRDFTINTLMVKLGTYDVLDLTGMGLRDLTDGILRTPMDAAVIFSEDPLRLLRLVRFVVRFDFTIDPATYMAAYVSSMRLPIVSAERIRAELTGILTANASAGLILLRELDLLRHTPLARLLDGVGMEQNDYHIYDVWGHTLACVDAVSRSAREVGVKITEELLYAAVLHDVGKPYVRTESQTQPGSYHFYDHGEVGVRLAADILAGLRFSGSSKDRICRLISLHMRVPHTDWSDGALRRLAVDAEDVLDELIVLMMADARAGNSERICFDWSQIRSNLYKKLQTMSLAKNASPLSGSDLMHLLGEGPGPVLGKVKDYLVSAVIDGRLDPRDLDAAQTMACTFYDGLPIDERKPSRDVRGPY